MNAIAFPILTGDVVTEAHAQICADRGHATWTVDGEDKGICPRCGDLTATPEKTEDEEALFEAIADLEWDAKQAKNTTLWTINPADTRGQHDSLVLDLRATQKREAQEAQAKLFGAIDALSPEQRSRYGTWRAER